MDYLLVEEVPTQSESQHSFVERVVGCQEVVLLARPSIHMTHHKEETCVLQMEVGIDVDNRIISDFCLAVTCLHRILT